MGRVAATCTVGGTLQHLYVCRRRFLHSTLPTMEINFSSPTIPIALECDLDSDLLPSLGLSSQSLSVQGNGLRTTPVYLIVANLPKHFRRNKRSEVFRFLYVRFRGFPLPDAFGCTMLMLADDVPLPDTCRSKHFFKILL